jgi:chromosome segregation ATPase
VTHAFLYVPSAANVLGERERHIALLSGELQQKDAWLEQSKNELAALNGEHQKLLAMFRDQQQELEKRTEWGLELNRELEAAGQRIAELQQELEREQAAARETVSAYEAKVSELDEENRKKTQWALDTEQRLGAELQAKLEELAQCVEYLHQAEATVDARTRWAEELQVRTYELERQVQFYRTSRWVRLGRRVGLGPKLPVK